MEEEVSLKSQCGIGKCGGGAFHQMKLDILPVLAFLTSYMSGSFCCVQSGHSTSFYFSTPTMNYYYFVN